MIELSIVTGTYNRLPYLQKMAQSVRSSLGFGIPYEIIVVDGGSTDGSQAWCKTQKDIVLIEQGELLGAIAAFDAGFKRARGRYVVIGGDDVVYHAQTLTRALVFMHNNLNKIGIGCLYQDRDGQPMHVSPMAAHTNGRMTSVPYGQKCIIPKWLGDACRWWELPGARTYGGDNALSARVIEAGWGIAAIPETAIHDALPDDELSRINNPPHDNNHPDTQAYLNLYPRGPEIGRPRSVFPPDGWIRPMRILYAPIYETNHQVQHEQKRGLRRALQRIGLVWEVDYLALPPEAILQAADIWQPDLIVTQFHDANFFTPYHAKQLRQRHPQAKIVNWNGDVYNRIADPKFASYAEALKFFDWQLTVSEPAAKSAAARGVRAAYWQIGFEADGVGYEPDANTRQHDILLLGNGYRPERHRLASVLKSLPYDTGIYGDYYPAGVAYAPTTYDFRAGCRLYRAAKVAISDDMWNERGFVSNRLLQCLAAGGALALQQRIDGLEELMGFQNEVHLVYYHDTDELPDFLAYWLHPDQDARRRKIAAQGQAFILKQHSFEARVKELMQLLQGRRPEPGVDPTLAAFHEVGASRA